MCRSVMLRIRWYSATQRVNAVAPERWVAISTARLIVLAIFAIATVPASVVAQEPADALDAVMLNRVWNSWHVRRDRCVRIEIGWSDEISSSISIRSPDTTPGDPSKRQLPRRSRNVLIMDGAKSRLSEFKFDESDAVSEERTVVFDGQHQKGLVRNERQQVLQGGVSGVPTPLGTNTKSAPIIALFRPFDGPSHFFDFTAAKIEQGSLVLDSMTAFPIRFRMPGIAEYTRRVWVSAECEFVPLQIDDLFGERLVSSIRIQYAANSEQEEWMPIGWVATVLGPSGDAISTTRGIVESIQFPQSLENEVFTLDFPSGTRFFDHEKEQRTFIVTRDGGAREFTPAQVAAGATQEDLMQGRQPSLNRWTVIRISAVVLSLIVLLMCVRLFRQRCRRS